MPRTRSPAGPAVHTTLRIAKPLHDKLTAAAGDKGIAEEIKQRLEGSFADPFRGSQSTREDLARLAAAARMLDEAYGDWRESKFARAVMSAMAQQVFWPETETPSFEVPKPGSRLARLTERDEWRKPDSLAFGLAHFPVLTDEHP